MWTTQTDANKTVLEANRLKVRTTSSLVVTGGSGLYYYPANAQDLPPNNQDGLLLFITYGAWGGQLAFPTGGGVSLPPRHDNFQRMEKT